MKHRVILKCYF